MNTHYSLKLPFIFLTTAIVLVGLLLILAIGHISLAQIASEIWVAGLSASDPAIVPDLLFPWGIDANSILF